MSTLRDLIFKRPSRQFQYLHVLLDLSSHEKDKVIPATLSWATLSLSRVLRNLPSLFHIPPGSPVWACCPSCSSVSVVLSF